MRRRINRLNWCGLTMAWLAISAITSAVSLAQQPGAEKQVTIKVREENIAKLKADIEKVKKQIDENCTTLEETIVTANAITDVAPYHRNTPQANFNQHCIADGTIAWASKSVLDPKDPDRNEDQTTVSAVATKLQASRTAEEGLVELITEPASVQVTYNGTTDARLRWDLDLRERKYATAFLNTLKELGANLKKRKELEKALAKEEAALEAQRSEPKAKPKTRRRR